LLAVSAVHVYLTYPFVLSWSMLEAMSAGCLVVGSATPPVAEVITEGETGLLADFHDPAAIAERILEGLADPARFAGVRRAARTLITERYDFRSVVLPRYEALLATLIRGDRPAENADCRPLA
ncbi:MAG: glycosyltransferase, partial [Ferrovibrionaceae bacterium]